MQSFMVFLDQRPLGVRTLQNQDLVKSRVCWFWDQMAENICRNIFLPRDMLNYSIIVLYIEFLLENFPGTSGCLSIISYCSYREVNVTE